MEQDNGSTPDSSQAKSQKGKPSLVEFPQKKTASPTPKEPTTGDPLSPGTQKSEPKNPIQDGLGPENSNGSLTKSESATPVPELREQRDRLKEILKKLRVKEKDLAKAPRITAFLRASTRGGLKAVLNAMRFAANDETVSIFLERYDKLSDCDKVRTPWEAICLAQDIDPNALAGAAMLAVANFSANRTRIIAVSNHPRITRARVKYALLPGGYRDRDALDTATGWLPTAKGPTFIGKAIFGGGAGSAQSQGKEKEDDGAVLYSESDNYDDLFPPPTVMQDKLLPIRQKLLEKGK